MRTFGRSRTQLTDRVPSRVVHLVRGIQTEPTFWEGGVSELQEEEIRLEGECREKLTFARRSLLSFLLIIAELYA